MIVSQHKRAYYSAYTKLSLVQGLDATKSPCTGPTDRDKLKVKRLKVDIYIPTYEHDQQRFTM